MKKRRQDAGATKSKDNAETQRARRNAEKRISSRRRGCVSTAI